MDDSWNLGSSYLRHRTGALSHDKLNDASGSLARIGRLASTVADHPVRHEHTSHAEIGHPAVLLAKSQ